MGILRTRYPAKAKPGEGASDDVAEKHIQEAMRRLMSGRTSFVVAHRLSTIREADQILAINAGEIVEQGAHNELLTAKGFYYRLFTGHFDAV